MSESAPERSRGGGNVFTNKLGPLPMWAWVAIAAAILLAWSYYKNKTSAASSSTAAGSTSASDVPQFVNQTYTTVTAPSAPGVTVTDTDTAVTSTGGGAKPPPAHKPPGVGEIGEGTLPHVVKPVAKRGGRDVEPIFNATYMVRKGETLNEVAAKFKISRVELAHANGLGTGAGLRTGQKLKVPSPAGTGTPNKAA